MLGCMILQLYERLLRKCVEHFSRLSITAPRAVGSLQPAKSVETSEAGLPTHTVAKTDSTAIFTFYDSEDSARRYIP